MLGWSSEGADLADAARIARLSEHYFVQQFRRVFSVSPHQFRIEHRMRLAHHLVLRTRLPIGHILQHLGLDSHSSFTRMFRRRFGVSATALRAEGGT